MALLDQIQDDLKKALKESEEAVRDTVRLLLSQIKNRAIELGEDLTDVAEKEVLTVVRKEIKKRKESIAVYIEGDRKELADKEKQELDILEKYIPEEMSAGDLEKVINEVVEEQGGKEAVNFGQVMKEVMKKTDGAVDGKIVSEAVKKVLA